MRKLLITCFAAFAGFAAWANQPDDDVFADTSLVALAVPVTSSATTAPELAPNILLSNATMALTSKLKHRPGNSPGQLAELLEATILPLFDFRHMTQLAVARNWRIATPDQQGALTAEFKTLLVHSYSAALADFDDHVIEYKPLRMAADETEVTVKSTVTEPGADRIAINYDMERTSSGWKIYDISIAGSSRIASYRPSFAQTVNDSGIDGLIELLAANNRHPNPARRPGEEGSNLLLFLYRVLPDLFRGIQ